MQPIARSIARPGGCCQCDKWAYRTHWFLYERGALVSQIDGEIKARQKVSLLGRAGSLHEGGRRWRKFPRNGRSLRERSTWKALRHDANSPAASFAGHSTPLCRLLYV